MPDLQHSLQKKDLGHLRIVAELWGLEFSAPDFKIGLQRLVPLLLNQAHLLDVVQALPDSAHEALEELIRSEGRMPWDVFQRRFGKVRVVGAARRDRDQPYQLGKASPAELLWYRALVAQEFSLSDSDAKEFAYIPSDLLALLPPPRESPRTGIGRPATPAEKSFIVPASDRILDDACTLLAAMRMDLPRRGLPDKPDLPSHYLLVNSRIRTYPFQLDHLQGILQAAGIVNNDGSLQPETARAFLEASRGEALLTLFRGWVSSQTFNDLRLIPGLSAEGEWTNVAARTRRGILDFLSTVPGADRRRVDPSDRPFWSLGAFVAAIRRQDPDFQRSAGEYDGWYLRDVQSGEFLRGFENWDKVDGEVIRFVICGPLHWLGAIDLAYPAAPVGNSGYDSIGKATAFRFSECAGSLMNFTIPTGLEVEKDAIRVDSSGRLFVPRLTRRSVRYQAARFGVWQRMKQEHFIYKLTPASLQAAQRQNLRVPQLIGFLRKHSESIPPSLVASLEKWEAEGSPARIDRLLVLRAKNPQIIQTIKASKLARYLGEPLGPAAIVIRSGALEKMVDGLAELGILAEVGFVEEQ